MMLRAVFLSVLELSLAIAPLLMVLLLLAPRLCGRYSARMRVLTWLLVAVRLLVPFNVSADGWALQIPLGSGHATPAAVLAGPEDEGERVLPAAVQDGLSLEGLDGDAWEPVDVGGQVRGTPEKTAFPQWDLVSALSAVWLAGVALSLLVQLAEHLWSCRSLRRWSTPVPEGRVREIYTLVAAQYGVKRPPPLYRSTVVTSPLLVGLLRPRIVLPPEACDDDKRLAIVLGHELCHVRRRDLWRKLALLGAGVLYWFHPLVHAMRRRAELDIEMACDEEALRDAGTLLRREYGFAVLGALEQGVRRRAPLSTGFVGSKKQMLQRFGQMVDGKPKRRGLLPLAVIAALVLVSGTLVGCADPAAPEEEPVPPVERVVDETPPVGEGDDTTPPDAETAEGYTLSDAESAFLEDIERNQSMAAQMQEEMEEIFVRLAVAETPATDEELAWPLPEHYMINSQYGYRFGGSDFHTGMDLSGADVYGAGVVAAASGEVVFVNQDYTPGVGYGIYLLVDHGGGLTTLYAQLSEVTVTVGERVERGQEIARVGATGWATGPHLHFEVREDGAHVDPWPYLAGDEAEKFTAPIDFVWPTDGGQFQYQLTYVPSNPIIPRPQGSPVYASAAGTATVVRETGTGYGRYILIDHGEGYMTLYAHCSELLIEEGEYVEQGQTIAEVGRTGNATGNCLRFEVRYNEDILDPTAFVTSPQ